MAQIKIETILGGQAPTSNFAAANQFRASLGIDPAQPIDDANGAYSTVASGLLRPAASEKFSGAVITSAPLWIKANPKNTYVYVYDANGSAYTVDDSFTNVVGVSDGGNNGLNSSLGNGCEYYDNYMYFAKNTDIARFGPLNGAAAMTGTFWTGTLAKAALANTAYPTTYKNKLQLPNHPMCRHSDGKLYFADVVGNLGTIHFIQTKYTAAEGDTDNGSTYNALDLGYGLWPTVIESYGTDIAIACYEGTNRNLRPPRAKIAFWDTTSGSPNKIVWVEFPDTIITAMKNINGVLYVVSGDVQSLGFRISRFIGGYTFEEVYYSETGEPCLPGAIDGILNRCIFGTYTNVPESDGCAYSTGLQKALLGTGLFNIMRCTGGSTSTAVTALLVADNTDMNFLAPILGWTQAGEGSTGVSHGLDLQATAYNNAPSVWWSQLFRIGMPFKITKIRIPLAQAIAANMTLTAKIYTDDGTSSYTLATINSTNDSGTSITRRAAASSTGLVGTSNTTITGKNNFWLELRWTGSALCTVSLPIIIDFEILDD